MGEVVYGSVCSGIEAATAAWHPLGWSPAFFSEIEAFPRAVLAHHYPEVKCHGDFTTIRAGEYDPIDLLVGGTPCQSFSVAGLRGGLSDERGNLALEYLRLAQRLRPRWLVWENVPGVLSSRSHDEPPEIPPGDDLAPGCEREIIEEYEADERSDFASFLAGLQELGYGFAYRVLDAQFFGLAQRRRRVFVVGYLGDWRRAAAVLFERHSLQGHPAPRREKGPSVAALTANGVGTCGADDNQGQAGHLVAHSLRAEGFDASEDGTGRGTPIVPVCFSSKDHGADAETDLAPTIRAGGHDGSHANAGVTPAIAFALRGREGGAMPEVGGDQVGSLRAASGGSSRDYVAFAHQGGGTQTRLGYDPDAGTAQTLSANQTPAIAGSAVRRLTPRECERLQGFADDFTLIPWRKGLAPDGPRYKALGNSMAVPVMAWIGKRIEAVEAISNLEQAA